MYTIGDFSRLAQVSKRLLRYYDEIGLLKPIEVDKFTGYRHYSAVQLQTLNRILALKELGLSLEQIQRLIKDNVSIEEIQGMLLMKKLELEQQLFEDMKRIRVIESRLKQIMNHEDLTHDVIVKQVPEQYMLGMRRVFPSFEVGARFFEVMIHALPQPSNTIYGHFAGIFHSDGLEEDRWDLEAGRLISTQGHESVTISSDIIDNVQLTVRRLPAVETMATFIQRGIFEEAHIGFSAIGEWAEANGYRFSGPTREILLEGPRESDINSMLLEIQFPVVRQSNTLSSDTTNHPV